MKKDEGLERRTAIRLPEEMLARLEADASTLPPTGRRGGQGRVAELIRQCIEEHYARADGRRNHVILAGTRDWDRWQLVKKLDRDPELSAAAVLVGGTAVRNEGARDLLIAFARLLERQEQRRKQPGAGRSDRKGRRQS